MAAGAGRAPGARHRGAKAGFPGYAGRAGRDRSTPHRSGPRGRRRATGGPGRGLGPPVACGPGGTGPRTEQPGRLADSRDNRPRTRSRRRLQPGRAARAVVPTPGGRGGHGRRSLNHLLRPVARARASMFPSPAFVSDLSEHLQRDVIAFLPELILCCTIVGMLLVRLVIAPNRSHLAVFALVMSALALAASVMFFWPGISRLSGAVIPETGGAAGFYGLLVFDTFGLYVRIFLLAFLCLSLWLSLVTGIPDREDSADYATLLVGGILGMMLMVSSNHLLMAFIAIEMASVPSYVLAGFLQGRRHGSEAALKYVVYGPSASGIMLYGISLMTGVYGTGSLPEIAKAVATDSNGLSLPVVAGAVCVLVGLG